MLCNELRCFDFTSFIWPKILSTGALLKQGRGKMNPMNLERLFGNLGCPLNIYLENPLPPIIWLFSNYFSKHTGFFKRKLSSSVMSLPNQQYLMLTCSRNSILRSSSFKWLLIIATRFNNPAIRLAFNHYYY